MIRIVNQKTTEISKGDLEQIRQGFNHVFGLDRPENVFLNQYLMNPFGYSYHTVVYDDDKVIGHTAAVPSYYMAGGKREVFADGIDAFILKEYRDGEIFMSMIQAFFKYQKENGIKVMLGVPDKTAMKLYIKTKIYKKIGNLDTYILPYRVGGVKPSLKLLNPLTKLFCRLYVGMTGMFSSKRCHTYMVEKEAETYNATRYKRMDGVYSEVHDGDLEFYYKISEFKGVRAAFLVDVVNKSAKNFSKAVKHIVKHDADKFDVIIYVGKLPFKNHGLIKVPHKFEPKEFNVILKFLDKSMASEDIMNIDNWDINLSSYDVI